MSKEKEIKTLEGVFVGTDFNGIFITKDGTHCKLARISKDKIDEDKITTINLDTKAINSAYIINGEIMRQKTNEELAEEIVFLQQQISELNTLVSNIMATK